MSNPEKTRMDTEEETKENSDESDYLWSDDEEEGDIRELVLALPALNLNVDAQSIREKAVAAAQLVMAAAEEAAVTKGTPDQTVGGNVATGENTKKKKLGRPRKFIPTAVVAAAGASGSVATGSVDGGEPVKKVRKKGSSQLTNPPQGPPKCNVCGKGFASWKAVFGHLRAHRDRGYQGFLPPPTFNAAEERTGGAVAGSSGSGRFGTGGLDIDLNAEPMEKEEGTGSGSGTTLKFDLNRSPPQDEEDDKEDKAE